MKLPFVCSQENAAVLVARVKYRCAAIIACVERFLPIIFYQSTVAITLVHAGRVYSGLRRVRHLLVLWLGAIPHLIGHVGVVACANTVLF